MYNITYEDIGEIMDFYKNKINQIAKKVESLENKYSLFSDEELCNQTKLFKQRLKSGESLDDILPEAFAVVREGANRVLGMKHFHEQIMGGIAIHDGKIAEMGTGEGKTLMSTLAVYLNALSGKGVHVITANEYLAARDAEEMGRLYNFLGLSVGLIYHGQSREEKKMSYNADVTYGTSSEFGFDYLRDNLVIEQNAKVCTRKRNFAIVDEADNVLIDEARTPLIITNEKETPEDLQRYVETAKFVETFDINDVTVSEKKNCVFLSEKGIDKVQKHYNIENLYTGTKETVDILYYINNAIRAKFLMKKDQTYIVKDGEVLIIDEGTGRAMEGRRYSNGLHCAIEAKEGLDIKGDGKTRAPITYQNYFSLYKKLSGMTGTAKTAEDEFRGIFGLEVTQIPSHLPVQRKDDKDVFFLKQEDKFNAICDEIERCHKIGQPILIGTQTIEESEKLAKLLSKRGISFQLLNAKEQAKEASIISNAGALGAVTIATNMAGRGTDIKLGGNAEYMTKIKMKRDKYSDDLIELVSRNIDYKFDDKGKQNEYEKAKKAYKTYLNIYKETVENERQKVLKLGGLKVIGTSRNESRRIDNQLIGRAGRQGDPGSSTFYVSAEDDILAVKASKLSKSKIFEMVAKDGINWGIFSKTIKSTQETLESLSYTARKDNLRYDNILSKQRKGFYSDRDKILENENVYGLIIDLIKDEIDDIVEKCYTDSVNCHEINQMLEKTILPKDSNFVTDDMLKVANKDELKEMVFKFVDNIIKTSEKINKEKNITTIYKIQYLNVMDKNWVDYLSNMEQIKDSIWLVGYAQQDPFMVYREKAVEQYKITVQNIRKEIV